MFRHQTGHAETTPLDGSVAGGAAPAKGGWIKLYRALAEHRLWRNGERFTQGQAWVDLLMAAAYADHVCTGSNLTVKVARGQVLTSQVKLAARWGWDRDTVSRYLKLLSTLGMVRIETSKQTRTGFTMLTILHYERFQGGGEGDPASEPALDPASNPASMPHPCRTIKNGKKGKKAPTALSALVAPDTKTAASTPEQHANGPEWGTPDALVALYHELIPAGHPRVTLPLSPARVVKAKDYLKRFPDRDFWVKSFGMVRQSSFLQGKVSTPDHKRFRGDFDWFLQRGKDGTENCLKAYEGKYLDEKSAEPEYLVTWGCATCGKPHKTSAALKGVCQKAAEEAHDAALRAARAEHLRLVPAPTGRS